MAGKGNDGELVSIGLSFLVQCRSGLREGLRQNQSLSISYGLLSFSLKKSLADWCGNPLWGTVSYLVDVKLVQTYISFRVQTYWGS